MAESSEDVLWEALVRRGHELLKVAQRIVHAAAELNVPTGYTQSMESMITIDDKMPIKFRVLEQANRLEALNELAKDLDSKLATRVVGGTEGGHAGVMVTQGASASKRPPPALVGLTRKTKTRALNSNKNCDENVRRI